MLEQKVLIIGAGLGGLVLANILHRHGVPFEIFERDEKIASRKQGWAVALIESLPAMAKALPEVLANDIYSNSVNHATGKPDELGFVNAETGEKVGHLGGVPVGEPGHFLRVSREGFRSFLFRGGVPVSMGKQFTHYEEGEDSVTAFFKDGSSSTGTLLVGADGVHSHVLDQLIGAAHHRPVLSRYTPIFGEVNLPQELYEPVLELGNAVILAGAPGLRIQLGLMDFDTSTPETASFFWAFMLSRDDPKPLADWAQSASKKELYDLVMEKSKRLHPTLKKLLEHGGEDALVKPPPKFLEFVPPNDLPARRVIVLGDAAHAMIPFRGAGANTAILDACDLGAMLVSAHQEQKDNGSVVRSYLDLMIPRGSENVLSSRAAGVDHGHPAEEWSAMFQRHKH